MRFWDSSAIIPLCLKESASEKIREILKEDEDMVVCWATRIECHSALERRRREGVLSMDTYKKTRGVMNTLAKEWSEVLPSEVVRQRTERLLSIHPIRTADAFQLAAALIWAEENPQDLDFICLDQNLWEGASKEGFTVLP